MNDIVTKEITKILFEQRENPQPSLTWRIEQRLLSAIRSGNVDAVERELHNPEIGQYREGLPQYSDDPYREALYSFLSANSLFARSAITGGVPDKMAAAICYAYVRTADKATGADQINALYLDAVLRYTKAVNEYRTNFTEGRSKVEQIKQYISTNLHETLTVQDIASSVFLNTSYCCELFKKETGMTIVDYIHEERLNSAANLLKYSDFSIQQICNYLGFNSPGYFSRLFRKKYGVTPHVYRQENKPDEFVL